MNCDRSKALVSVYVDGELSEELAGPLRRHLMECAECRASVSEAKAMSSWFVPSAPVSVPEGFAARVARLATAGAGSVVTIAAAGSRAAADDCLVPTRASHDPRHVTQSLPGGRGRLRSVDGTARFAMSLAAVAATVLIGLTFMLASGDGGGFDGSSIQAQPPIEDALQALERLNQLEADAAAAGVTPTQAVPEVPSTVAPSSGAPGAAGPPGEAEQPKSPR